MYKLIKSLRNEINVVQRIIDGAVIPFDPDNSDYQAYLKFLEDGGIPEPADK